MRTTTPMAKMSRWVRVRSSLRFLGGRLDQRDEKPDSFFNKLMIGSRAAELGRSLREKFECLFGSQVLIHERPLQIGFSPALVASTA